MEAVKPYARLRGKIVEKCGTQGRFADKIGISETMLARKLAGRAAISVKDMYKWGAILGIEEDDFVAYFIRKF